MKDKIEVGEYVRTEIGTIGKVKTIYYAGSGTRYYGEDLYKNYYSIDYNKENEYGRFSEDEIVKHSPNIIDLIEKGDYVNGVEVIWVNKYGIVHCNSEDTIDYNAKEIETIVTHQQFKEMEYRL